MRTGTFSQLPSRAKVTPRGAQVGLVHLGGLGRSRGRGEKTPQTVLAQRRFLPAVAPGPPRTPGDRGAIWKDLRTTRAEGGLAGPTFPRRPGSLQRADPISPQVSKQRRRAGGKIQTRLLAMGGAGGWGLRAGLVFRKEPPLSVGLQRRGCS